MEGSAETNSTQPTAHHLVDLCRVLGKICEGGFVL